MRGRPKTLLIAALLGLSGLMAGTARAQPAAPAMPAKAEPCVACHGPGGRSQIPLNPVLAGRTARYLYLQLRDFLEGRRSNPQMTPMVAGNMASVSNTLSDTDIEDLAHFLTGL